VVLFVHLYKYYYFFVFQGGILILTGPSGSGKTATVQVLSTKLGVRVQEWTNPASAEPHLGKVDFKYIFNQKSSQLAQFQEFLLRVNKYKCLKMKGERGAAEKKLILVEVCTVSSTFLRLSVSTFFVFFDTVRNSESRCWANFNIDNNFKFFSCIIYIRSAINSLQFCCLLGLCTLKKPPTISLERAAALSKKKGKQAKSAKEHEEHQPIGGKDVSFFLFRALGKILHCKRASGLVLPFHLLQHNREVLLVQPELVVERSETSGEFFSLCLHQNYLDFFSDIEDVDRASEYLSDADLLAGNWMIRHTIGDYGSSVATRGLIHSNSCQLPVGFRPLHKPSWCLVNKKHQDNCVAAQSLFRSFCLTPVGLQTQLLPFLAKLCNPTRSQGSTQWILKLENLRDKEMGQEIEEEEELHCRIEKDPQVCQSHLITNRALLEEEEVIIEEYDSD
uniref:RAD17 checkpoint clamp loader component n=1 Tax=Poecilia latipinna TaxID=48699 RepID=A0A3B3VD27_9TELE